MGERAAGNLPTQIVGIDPGRYQHETTNDFSCLYKLAFFRARRTILHI